MRNSLLTYGILTALLAAAPCLAQTAQQPGSPTTSNSSSTNDPCAVGPGKPKPGPDCPKPSAATPSTTTATPSATPTKTLPSSTSSQQATTAPTPQSGVINNCGSPADVPGGTNNNAPTPPCPKSAPDQGGPFGH